MEGLQVTESSASPESLWNDLKNVIVRAANNHIPKEVRKGPTNHWMTQEIKDLMQERRLAKGDPDKYNQIQSTVLQKCIEAKEQWLEQKCQDIEK